MNRVTETAPERIYLQVGLDAHQCDDDFPPHGDDVTWQDESTTECEVEYMRADIAQRRIAELEKALQGLVFLTDYVDETGYVEDVGFVYDFKNIKQQARDALNSTKEAAA